MPNDNFGPTKFGPGGQVLAENQELIAAIKNTLSLTPATLLKLADFYQEFPPNQPLGNHLCSVALSILVRQPEVEAVLDKAAQAHIDWSDIFEDMCDITPDDEKKEDPKDCLQSVQIVRDGNVNLLTETVISQGQESFFVIGVAPDLANL